MLWQPSLAGPRRRVKDPAAAAGGAPVTVTAKRPGSGLLHKNLAFASVQVGLPAAVPALPLSW